MVQVMPGLLDRPTRESIVEIEVEGALRTPLRFSLTEKVLPLLSAGARWIVLDLTRLTHMDAAGLGELVHAFNTARAHDGVLQIVNPNPRVRRLLDVTGLLDLLTNAVSRQRHPPGCGHQARAQRITGEFHTGRED
jgi:anti-anti-sigma factor